jgi:hypothetical protein
MKLEILILVVFKNNFDGFGSKYITNSSIIISSIISLFINSFNVFLIIFIIKREY